MEDNIFEDANNNVDPDFSEAIFEITDECFDFYDVVPEEEIKIFKLIKVNEKLKSHRGVLVTELLDESSTRNETETKNKNKRLSNRVAKSKRVAKRPEKDWPLRQNQLPSTTRGNLLEKLISSGSLSVSTQKSPDDAPGPFNPTLEKLMACGSISVSIQKSPVAVPAPLNPTLEKLLACGSISVSIQK